MSKSKLGAVNVFELTPWNLMDNSMRVGSSLGPLIKWASAARIGPTALLPMLENLQALADDYLTFRGGTYRLKGPTSIQS